MKTNFNTSISLHEYVTGGLELVLCCAKRAMSWL